MLPIFSALKTPAMIFIFLFSAFVLTADVSGQTTTTEDTPIDSSEIPDVRVGKNRLDDQRKITQNVQDRDAVVFYAEDPPETKKSPRANCQPPDCLKCPKNGIEKLYCQHRSKPDPPDFEHEGFEAGFTNPTCADTDKQACYNCTNVTFFEECVKLRQKHRYKHPVVCGYHDADCLKDDDHSGCCFGYKCDTNPELKHFIYMYNENNNQPINGKCREEKGFGCPGRRCEKGNVQNCCHGYYCNVENELCEKVPKPCKKCRQVCKNDRNCCSGICALGKHRDGSDTKGKKLCWKHSPNHPCRDDKKYQDLVLKE